MRLRIALKVEHAAKAVLSHLDICGPAAYGVRKKP
jgi:hypothetical protein